MADDKKTTLSIIVRTVDEATAKIKAINDRLDATTKPIRDFKSALSDLRSKSGLDDVIGGFKGIGSAIGDLLGKVAMVGGGVELAIGYVFHLVDGFDDLGKKAARLGVSVDFLAAMRDAAERTGVPLDSLDESLDTFAVNLGKARVGAGRMTKFLPKVATNLHSDFGAVLLRQLTAAKGNAAALDVLADAMAKLTDPADRAALAMATVGDSKLAPMLALGSKRLDEMGVHFIGLAGSQEGAAKGAAEVHDSMLNLKTTIDGIKASIVEGLSPALKILVDQLSEWFAGHREDIKEWASEVGKKLPGAVHAVIDAIKEAVGWLAGFFDSSTKIKIALVALGAVLVGPLLLAIATFGVALLSTPVGWFLGVLAGITIAVIALVTHLKEVKDWFAGNDVIEGINKVTAQAKKEGRKATIQELFPDQFAKARADQDKEDSPQMPAQSLIEDLQKSSIGAQQPSQQMQPMQQAKIEIALKNAPPNTRVTTDPKNTADVDVTTGYQMVHPW